MYFVPMLITKTKKVMSKNMIEKAKEAVDGFTGLYEKTEQRYT